MSSNFRIGVLLASCVVVLAGAVAAGVLMMSIVTHGSIPAWYAVGWVITGLAMTVAGGMLSYRDGWRSEYLMLGALVGGVVGIVAGIMWPVIVWLIIGVGIVGLWVVPWSNRNY
jgi:hypothetical protein